MKAILLDREGDARLPAGCEDVDSEVDFLKLAMTGKALLVRGEPLCAWAGRFYEGRNISTREAWSPLNTLIRACPTLTRAQARTLEQQLGDSFDYADTITVPYLLQVLYPARLWNDSPSSGHAAHWLLWLWQTPVPEHIFPLLSHMAAVWHHEAENRIRRAYEVTGTEEARHLLWGWLGIESDADERMAMGTFPLGVPKQVEDEAAKFWHDEAIRSQGAFFEQRRWHQVPQRLVEIAAEQSATYFCDHPQHLSQDRFQRLARYLGHKTQQQLRQFLLPPIPSDLPQESESILGWFEQEYLPFRLWQKNWGNDEHRAHVHRLALQFALWYLEQYPPALVGGTIYKSLSFTRSADLANKESNQITLLVVLDGLHVQDGKTVINHLRGLAPRLTIREDLVFSPLPTVTEFAKPALFKGTTPKQAQVSEDLGQIAPEGKLPTRYLQENQSTGLILWRVQEPDHTYHTLNGHDTIDREVETRLEAIAKNLADIVEGIPSEVWLNIIVTTDHGRLLAHSSRNMVVPGNMEAHQRAAWGDSRRKFPASGYLIEGQIGYLHAERFGLPDDVAIVLGEEMFQTQDGKGGQEKYPHGGLFPEEVIIPWVVMVRDAHVPRLEIHLSGKAPAREQGQLTIETINLGDIACHLQMLRLDLEGREVMLPLDLNVPAGDRSDCSLSLAPWPSAEESQHVSAIISLQQPNGLRFEITAASVDIQSEEMYHRDDDILGDLTI